jgi:tetrahydrodipicolinate N-succinyltransferase
VQGQVDLDVEMAKCDKKLDLAQMNLAKVQKVEAQADYAQTVPADVRAINEDKVRRSACVCISLVLMSAAAQDARGRDR